MNFIYTIISSIIAGLSVLAIASFIRYLKKPSVSNSRIKALEGKWRGTVSQPSSVGGSGVDYNATLELTVSWRSVRGNFDIETPISVNKARPIDTHIMDGVFRYGKYLHCSYTNKKLEKYHFGSFILELDNDGNRMKGAFTGYGKTNDTIINGDVHLTKC